MPVATAPLRKASEHDLEILDAHYINTNEIEMNGGKILISETQVVCRIPKDTGLAAACEIAVAMTTLSPDLFVAAPNVETEAETGDVLVRLDLSDTPKLEAYLASKITYEQALEQEEEL